MKEWGGNSWKNYPELLNILERQTSKEEEEGGKTIWSSNTGILHYYNESGEGEVVVVYTIHQEAGEIQDARANTAKTLGGILLASNLLGRFPLSNFVT